MKDKTPKTHASPFDDLPRTPASHFRLYFFAAVAHVTRQLVAGAGTYEGAFEAHPFLRDYFEELAGREPDDLGDGEASLWWERALRVWEAGARGTHLPLRALRESCALEHDTMTLLVGAGLAEEDARFGALYEEAQDSPGQRRPTLSLLQAWWRDSEGCERVRAGLRRLQRLGLLQLSNTDAPRSEWVAQVPAALWDVCRGEACEEPAPWLGYHAPEALAALDELILPAELKKQAEALPHVLAAGGARALVVRGPGRNGRRTLQGAVARALGRGVLEIDGACLKEDGSRWRLAGALACALGAWPVVKLDVAPGECVELPPLGGYEGGLGVVLGAQGGIAGEWAESAVTIRLDVPEAAERREHWRRALGGRACEDLDLISERRRMTGGNIRRAARLAVAQAALEGRDEVTLADVRQAGRSLNRQALDTLATRVESSGRWDDLAAGAETVRELRHLEGRCRRREMLREGVGSVLGSQLGAGVRALFSGPSGTGKSFAARLLASSLEMDLYRLDLSAVVNKYIGETEKNLSQIFSRAEELDVILLLDEGDALLAQRTDVGNSTDRYANLETNYLLQRLESFEGILVVTTNASDRIDPAFARRLDVVVNFRAPDARERWAIFQSHLPERHGLPASLLDEVAARCELSGGQIRNVVLHAAALALDDGRTLGAEHFDAAVRREYRKAGGVCPLRRHDAAQPASSGRW